MFDFAVHNLVHLNWYLNELSLLKKSSKVYRPNKKIALESKDIIISKSTAFNEITLERRAISLWNSITSDKAEGDLHCIKSSKKIYDICMKLASM